ncbi:MAG: antitoxin [Ignavibacteria bacterium]|nr:antitoxin [Ignavibacteria bacterium]
MTKYIDHEEKEIIESLYADEWLTDFDESIKKAYVESAQLNRYSAKQINIEVSEQDYQKILAKARESGVPYQAIVSMLIQKYNEGKIAFI